MTSDEVLALLRAKYCPPHAVLLAEVANGTGSHARRHADAVAMGCWPSTGMELEGFEIKVARSDWLRELKEPAKHAAVAEYCDRWWIVCPPDVLVPDEVPKGWGVLIAKEGGLRAARPAPLLEAKPLTRTFVASLLRNSVEAAAIPGKAALEGARAQGYAEGKRDGVAEGAFDNRLRKFEALERNVARFEAASGVKIADEYGHRDIGHAVAAVMALQAKTRYEGLRTYVETLDELRVLADAALKAAGDIVEPERK